MLKAVRKVTHSLTILLALAVLISGITAPVLATPANPDSITGTRLTLEFERTAGVPSDRR